MKNRMVASEDAFFDPLKQLLSALEASGHAIFPTSNDALLNSIIEAAANIFNAAAASILLVDEDKKHLEFKVAYGAANHDLVGTRVPLDKGIAGYVVMTGQPLAISNVRQDPRFNQDFAKSTGYVPSSILATPLLMGDRVIGVMEVLDKVNASSFGMRDMELLALFARQVAIAIDQSQLMDKLKETLIMGLKRIIQPDDTLQPDELIAALDRIGNDPSSKDLLALADLFNEMSTLGESERKACIQILKTFIEYRQATHKAWL